MKKVYFLFWFINFSVSVKAQKDTVVTATNIFLETITGKLAGSITVPTTTKKVPLVIIIAGSGPTDRNCNSKPVVISNAYKILADSLLKYGIASLRYDKRGAGESMAAMTNRSTFRFANYIDDATEWIQLLQKDKRFSSIIIAGHSEGSLVGMMAAKITGANKFISIAGAGFPIQDVLRKQFGAQPNEVKDLLLTRLDTLITGKLLTNVPTSLYSIYSSGLQPYLIDWFKYVPAVEIAKLTIPVLILNGTTDIQVGVEEAENLHKVSKQSKMVLVNGMSHLLKDAPADRTKNIASYTTMANEPIKTELVQAIVKFIKK